jgi:hypothetical protein
MDQASHEIEDNAPPRFKIMTFLALDVGNTRLKGAR